MTHGSEVSLLSMAAITITSVAMCVACGDCEVGLCGKREASVAMMIG